MLVHNDFPEDLEAPAETLDSFLTPVERFFVPVFAAAACGCGAVAVVGGGPGVAAADAHAR